VHAVDAAGDPGDEDGEGKDEGGAQVGQLDGVEVVQLVDKLGVVALRVGPPAETPRAGGGGGGVIGWAAGLAGGGVFTAGVVVWVGAGGGDAGRGEGVLGGGRGDLC